MDSLASLKNCLGVIKKADYIQEVKKERGKNDYDASPQNKQCSLLGAAPHSGKAARSSSIVSAWQLYRPKNRQARMNDQ